MYSQTKKIATNVDTNWYSNVFDLSWLKSGDISIICLEACTWDIILEKSFDWTNWYWIEGASITLDWSEFVTLLSRSITINTSLKLVRLKNTSTWSIDAYLSAVYYT